jgi:hypothetical protein
MRTSGNVTPAAQSSRTPVLIAAVVLALGGIAILNRFQEMNDPKYQERMEREKQREEAKKAQEQAAKNPAQGGLTADDPANELATFGAEKVLGDAKATQTVTVGWQWTPQVQADPKLVYGAVDAVQKAAPRAKIRVVNLDAKPGAVPAGVTVNGNTIVPAGPNGSIPTEAVSAAVPSVLASSAASAAPATAPSAAAPAPPAAP